MTEPHFGIEPAAAPDTQQEEMAAHNVPAQSKKSPEQKREDRIRRSQAFKELSADWFEHVFLAGNSKQDNEKFAQNVRRLAPKNGDEVAEYFFKENKTFDTSRWFETEEFANWLDRAAYQRLTDLFSLDETALYDEVQSDVKYKTNPDLLDATKGDVAPAEMAERFVRERAVMLAPEAFEALGRHKIAEHLQSFFEAEDLKEGDTLAVEIAAPESEFRVIPQRGEVVDEQLPVKFGDIASIWVHVDQDGVMHAEDKMLRLKAGENSRVRIAFDLRQEHSPFKPGMHLLPFRFADAQRNQTSIRNMRIQVEIAGDDAAPGLAVIGASGVLLDQELPRIAGDTVRAWITVTERGEVLLADQFVQNSNGKLMQRVVYDIAGRVPQSLGPGRHLVNMRVRDVKELAPLPITEQRFLMEAPNEKLFEVNQELEPVGYTFDTKRNDGYFVLPDGTHVIMPRQYHNIVDKQSGELLDSNFKPSGHYPKIRTIFSERLGLTCEVYDKAQSDLHNQVDRALMQYLMVQEGRGQWPEGLGSSMVTASMPERTRAAAREALREGSTEFPLPLVVSAQSATIRKGFENIFAYVSRQVGRDAGLDVVNAAARRASQSYNGMMHAIEHNQNPSQPIQERYFEEYVNFFKTLYGYKAATGIDLRTQMFPSDLDGETGVQILRQAGVESMVVPAPPMRHMQLGGNFQEFLPGAMHLDWSHDSGIMFKEVADKATTGESLEATRLAVFLDEGGHSRSGADAMYSHLKHLGLIDESDMFSENVEERMRYYLVRFVNTVDMFDGPLSRDEGRQQILANFTKNIFGISDALVSRDVSRPDLVIEFFNQVVPEIEAEEREKMNVAHGADKNKLTQRLADRIMDRLTTYDASQFFAQNYPKLFLNGDKGIPAVLKLIENKYQRSIECVEKLHEWGFVIETPKGRMLVDPFNSIPSSLMRGMLPITPYKRDPSDENFRQPCNGYIGYNSRYHIGTVILSASARDVKGNRVLLPENFLAGPDGHPKGMVIKYDDKEGGYRMFVMNESSQRLHSLGELIHAFVGDEFRFQQVTPAVSLIMDQPKINPRAFEAEFLTALREFQNRPVPASARQPEQQQRQEPVQAPVQQRAPEPRREAPPTPAKKTPVREGLTDSGATEIMRNIGRDPFSQEAIVLRKSLAIEYANASGDERVTRVIKEFMVKDGEQALNRAALAFKQRIKKHRADADALGMDWSGYKEQFFADLVKRAGIEAFCGSSALGENEKDRLQHIWYRVVA